MLLENKDGKAGDEEVGLGKAFFFCFSCTGLLLPSHYNWFSFLSLSVTDVTNDAEIAETNVENISQKKHYPFSFIAR